MITSVVSLALAQNQMTVLTRVNVIGGVPQFDFQDIIYASLDTVEYVCCLFLKGQQHLL